jgi:hypothetical protein
MVVFMIGLGRPFRSKRGAIVMYKTLGIHISLSYHGITSHEVRSMCNSNVFLLLLYLYYFYRCAR